VNAAERPEIPPPMMAMRGIKMRARLASYKLLVDIVGEIAIYRKLLFLFRMKVPVDW